MEPSRWGYSKCLWCGVFRPDAALTFDAGAGVCTDQDWCRRVCDETTREIRRTAQFVALSISPTLTAPTTQANGADPYWPVPTW